MSRTHKSLYLTITTYKRLSLTVTCKALNEITSRFEFHAMHETSLIRLVSVKSCLFNGCIKVSRTTDILTALNAVSTILLIELPRLFFQIRAKFTAVCKEMSKPVIVLTV